MEVTTLQDYSHQEGYMTQQCVIFASRERVKEVLSKHDYGDVWSVNYDEAVALLVDAGITVIPVIGFGADGFNSEIFDMAAMKEYAPGLHFHDRPIMELVPLEDTVASGRNRLQDR